MAILLKCVYLCQQRGHRFYQNTDGRRDRRIGLRNRVRADLRRRHLMRFWSAYEVLSAPGLITDVQPCASPRRAARDLISG